MALTMPNTSYPPLLPATGPRSPPISAHPPARKRISVACDVCRNRRTQCDGSRPTCSACSRRGSQCTYPKKEDRSRSAVDLKHKNTELRAKIAAFHDVIGLLQGMSPDDAQHSLHHLMNSQDPVAILNTLRGQSMGTSMSDEDTARAFFPAAHSKCELELLVRHPFAYPAPDVSSRAKSLRLHLSSFYTPPTTPLLPSKLPSTEIQASSLPEPPGHGESLPSNPSPSPSSMPQYFDPRLAQLNVGFWTSVPMSNAYAAEAISAYLEIQHPVWGLFDAWLFVRDLVQLRFDFCSPFMLNSLLAAAFVSMFLCSFYGH